MIPNSLFYANAARFQAFDLLASLVVVVRADATVLFSNSALEDFLGTSRRATIGSRFSDVFTDPLFISNALDSARDNAFAVLRYDAFVKRHSAESVPVHVIITTTECVDEMVVEMVPLEQQNRQDREDRLLEQVQTNKELVRNLAHEIKNPLGGIRGAASGNGDGVARAHGIHPGHYS
jgi:two-component system, NtrC family, nitrogen regulation sensor histidine kinase GlnL